VLALEEPLGLALAELEGAPDEVCVEAPLPSPPSAAPQEPVPAPAPDPVAAPKIPRSRARGAVVVRWTAVDVAVMGTALSILAASLVGLVWLFHR